MFIKLTMQMEHDFDRLCQNWINAIIYSRYMYLYTKENFISRKYCINK